jgi:hypothetical protein
LQGSFFALTFYDIAEQIQTDQLHNLAATQRAPGLKHPAPDYVRFQIPVSLEYPEPVTLSSGERVESRIKFFDYGVVCVELEIAFNTEWNGLVQLSNRWMADPQLEKMSADLLRSRLDRIKPAMVQPYPSWLNEDYFVIQVTGAVDPAGQPLTAKAMIDAAGDRIVQIVRGESIPLGEAERNETLQSCVSYYPTDLLVAGWTAAFLYDTPESAISTRLLLEYANTQLLEFRHYDDVLTKVLSDVYKKLEHKRGWFSGWKMGRDAERLNAMRLEVTELTERSDNAIKFLSDMFYAKAYRMAASKVGVNDYRVLVEEKLRIAGELYQSMVNEFHQARAFVLEAMVVAILVIELIHLFGNWR